MRRRWEALRLYFGRVGDASGVVALPLVDILLLLLCACGEDDSGMENAGRDERGRALRVEVGASVSVEASCESSALFIPSRVLNNLGKLGAVS